MSATTGITWTDATWNPWMGCTRVSPGCASCYMFREQERYGNDPNFLRRSKTTFRDPLKKSWALPRRIFTCSWSDFFHQDADAWRPEVWEIIRQTPQHTYQILTKRPERVIPNLPADWYPDPSGDAFRAPTWATQPQWRHVWLGVSIENQRWVERIEKMPARAKLFISAEPLLGPLDLREWLSEVGWVIVGGESGPDARPMDLAWAADIQAQCQVANVPFFFKQRSGPTSGLTDGVPPELLVREFPGTTGVRQ